jgi:alpha-amylase
MANKKTICLYLHVHQPYRLAKLNYLQLANLTDYFSYGEEDKNREIIDKVAGKSYEPTNKLLSKLITKFGKDFQFSLSITGTIIEQLQKFKPKVLSQFQELVNTGNVELLAETNYHSLASIYSLTEFCEQISIHNKLLKEVFNYSPSTFRNTELVYNDEIAAVIAELGYKQVIAEGWDKFLKGRSSNYIYYAHLDKLTVPKKRIIDNFKQEKESTAKLKLLLKNYKLSDDIAFRFSDPNWEHHPLSVDKYLDWIEANPGEVINLFMDYETFGEHQWQESGIFEFMEKFIIEAIKRGFKFSTISEAAHMNAMEEVSVTEVTSWADIERDLSAWNGNNMQKLALKIVYGLEDKVRKSKSIKKTMLTDEWRKLQTSDHFYYMSTKYWNDGDVHKYFSPYDSPYEAFINYMNILEDFEQKLDYEVGTAHAKKNRLRTNKRSTPRGARAPKVS